MDEDRALSTKVYEALLNVIKETKMLALQEVSRFQDRYLGKSRPLSSLRLLREKENSIKYETDGEFAFVYDTNHVNLASDQNPRCGVLKTGKHKYAYWCKFKVQQYWSLQFLVVYCIGD